MTAVGGLLRCSLIVTAVGGLLRCSLIVTAVGGLLRCSLYRDCDSCGRTAKLQSVQSNSVRAVERTARLNMDSTTAMERTTIRLFDCTPSQERFSQSITMADNRLLSHILNPQTIYSRHLEDN